MGEIGAVYWIAMVSGTPKQFTDSRRVEKSTFGQKMLVIDQKIQIIDQNIQVTCQKMQMIDQKNVSHRQKKWKPSTKCACHQQIDCYATIVPDLYILRPTVRKSVLEYMHTYIFGNNNPSVRITT